MAQAQAQQQAAEVKPGFTYGGAKMYVASKRVTIEFPGGVLMQKRFTKSENLEKFVEGLVDIVDSFDLAEKRVLKDRNRDVYIFEAKHPLTGWAIFTAAAALAGLRSDYIPRWVNAIKALSRDAFLHLVERVASMYGGDFNKLPITYRGRGASKKPYINMSKVRSEVGKFVRAVVESIACSKNAAACPSRRRRGAVQLTEEVAQAIEEAASMIDRAEVMRGDAPSAQKFYEALAKKLYEVYERRGRPESLRAVVNTRGGEPKPKSPRTIARLWRAFVDTYPEKAKAILTRLGFPEEYVELYKYSNTPEGRAQRARMLVQMLRATGRLPRGRSRYNREGLEQLIREMAQRALAEGKKYQSKKDFAREVVAEARRLGYIPADVRDETAVNYVYRMLNSVLPSDVWERLLGGRMGETATARARVAAIPEEERVREIEV